MPVYQLKLISSKTVSRQTVEFTFEKPDGFQYIAGQYGGFTLNNPATNTPMTRRFSLLSAPYEPHLRIATRIKASEYKDVLLTLQPNDTIKFAGPTGNFILHEDKNVPAVFLAGGIGITPFYSMIMQLQHSQDQRKIVLFYANNEIDDAAYLDEFSNIARQNHSFSFFPILQHASTTWSGERGVITTSLVDNYFDCSNTNATFYVCGSPGMVQAMQRVLDELAIPAENTKLEDFPGY